MKFIKRWYIRRQLKKLDPKMSLVVMEKRKDQTSHYDRVINLELKKLPLEDPEKIWRLRFLIANKSQMYKIIIEHHSYNMSDEPMPPIAEIYDRVYGEKWAAVYYRKYKLERNKKAMSLFIDFCETYLED